MSLTLVHSNLASFKRHHCILPITTKRLNQTGITSIRAAQSSSADEQRPFQLPIFSPAISSIRAFISQSKQSISGFSKDAKIAMVQLIVDALFKESDEININFAGNFAPVEEIGHRMRVDVIEGAIPKDFPIGVYIRNGANPQFGGKSKTSSLLGTSFYHWFEGDGMLHATYFEPSGQVSYQNKFVETKGYKEEKKHGKSLWLTAAVGDFGAIIAGIMLNMLQFGEVNKQTCNTSVLSHAGRLFANAESGIPYEIDPSTLATIGEWDIGKLWGRPFTAHPKTVRETREMVMFGYDGSKPYYKSGIISADGKKIIHTCDVELEKPIFSHDISITKNYDLIMDFPLSLDVQRLFSGGSLFEFQNDANARIGVKPRLGDSKSIRWFQVDTHYMFHVVNSYEDGDEIVLHGLRSRGSFFPPKLGVDKVEWYARGITPTPIEDAKDPKIDGALFTSLHEWRLNLCTGDVVEKRLTNHVCSMEMPRINDDYVGYKYRFAYAGVIDYEASCHVGMPKYGKLVKMTIPNKGETCGLEFYDPGPGIFLSEPLFVSKRDGLEEDDGWIVTYVHDENTETSEVHIIDAKAFLSRAVTRIQLPQRVPYGFHSTFAYGSY